MMQRLMRVWFLALVPTTCGFDSRGRAFSLLCLAKMERLADI